MYGNSARHHLRSPLNATVLSYRRVIRGAWRASRPHNAAVAAVSTTLGTWLSSTAVPPAGLASVPEPVGSLPWGVAAPLCALFAVAAANLYNDACDVQADQVNAPHRPIPQGQLSPRQATIAAMVCALVASVCALWLQGAAQWLALLAIPGGLVYSRRLKSSVLLGNAWVAVWSASTVVVGALQHGPVPPVVWMAGITLMLFILAREILKCIADRVGDAQAHVTSVATALGVRSAALILLAVTLLCALSLALPVMLPHSVLVRSGFLVCAGVGGILPLFLTWQLVVAHQTHGPPTPAMHLALRRTKLGGVLLLGAFALLGV